MHKNKTFPFHRRRKRHLQYNTDWEVINSAADMFPLMSFSSDLNDLFKVSFFPEDECLLWLWLSYIQHGRRWAWAIRRSSRQVSPTESLTAERDRSARTISSFWQITPKCISREANCQSSCPKVLTSPFGGSEKWCNQPVLPSFSGSIHPL